jgi:hypothetical protein
MTETILLLSPANFLELAEKNGYNRTQAIALTRFSSRSWDYWCYEGHKPSLSTKNELATLAIAKGWL